MPITVVSFKLLEIIINAITIIITVITISVFTLAIILYINYKKMKALPTPEELLNIKATQDFLISINDAKNDYFRNSLKEELKAKHKELYEELSSSSNKKYLGNSIVSDFIKIYSELDLLVKEWNLNFVKQELTNNVGLFNDIDGDSLDALQRYAVVVDEDNNLVLAGAGSGKTLTVSAKVKYLVEKKNIKPEEILLISFTTKAAEEMKERIKNRLKINIEAKTFHKLGLDIISKDRGKRPDVADNIYLSDVISKYFKEEISKNKTAISDFVTYFGIYLNIPKDLEEFDNLGIVYDHYKNIDFETIKSKIDSKIESKKNNRATIQGEIVRSVEEVIIANFLYLNGVEYTYEKVYPFESDDKFRKRYRPDFYLDDYDIYLEHFGITEDYRVPWLTKIEATKYLDDINWKREFHKENGTTLIETYSYFNKSGNLHTELDKLLKAYNVAYKEVDYAEIYTKLFSEQEDKYFLEFKKLVQSFIGLFKSKGYSEDDFDLLNKMPLKVENRFLSDRTRFFLSIVKPIYIFYQKQLENSGEIDFNDMINMATDIVKNGEPEPLKYIIIDEYQDISVSRFNLIKELKNKTNARVMAVGDDWQSIYRFTGSDIDLFANFSKYLGYSEVLRIERTYRNSQELIDIAGNFIMKNTKQLSKNLTSDKHYSSPIRILGYDKEIDIAIKNAVEEIVYLYGEKAEIMILGRNNFDIDVLDSSPFFKIYRNLKSVSLKYLKYPDVKLSFLTTHRSKGLEADNVIIINLVNTLLGFPNKIADDPILSLVLTDLEGYSFAEERRLFYVAITRTKNSTYLIVPDRNQSSFAEELIKSFNIKYDISTGETSIQDNPNCTKCQKGYFVLRENKTNGSKFLSCTNYPQCDRTLKNIEILDGYIKCNICGGYMVIRHGLYGDFYGCTNYPHYCQNKIRIENGGSDKN